MQDSKYGWVWKIAILIGLIIILLIFAPHFSRQPSPGGGIMPTYAPQGQVVSGFPAGLLLDKNAALSKSYALSYSATTKQYTAQWTSSNPMAAELSQYQKYFAGAGWKVTANPITQVNLRALSAANANGYVLVNIVEQGNGSQVTITYVSK